MMLKEFYTDRLIIHETTMDEWRKYVHDILASDDDLWLQYGYEPDVALAEAIEEPTFGVIYYSVILKATNEMVGYVGIAEWKDNEIEFYTFRKHRKNGYCKEAVAAFVKEYTEGNVNGETREKVTAEIMSENTAAESILKSVGFEKIATGMTLGFKEENGNKLQALVSSKVFWYRKDN